MCHYHPHALHNTSNPHSPTSHDHHPAHFPPSPPSPLPPPPHPTPPPPPTRQVSYADDDDILDPDFKAEKLSAESMVLNESGKPVKLTDANKQ